MTSATLYKEAQYYFPFDNRYNILNLNGVNWAEGGYWLTEISGMNDIALQANYGNKPSIILAQDTGCPSNPALCSGLTVAFWLKYWFSNSNGAQRNVFTTGGMYANDGIGFRVFEMGDEGEKLAFSIKKSDLSCTYVVEFPTWIWMHVAFTWDGRELLIYRNGEVVKDFLKHVCNSANFGTKTYDNYTRIAHVRASASYDEFALWNRVLQNQEIQKIVTFYRGRLIS